MVRAASSFITFFRQTSALARQNPNLQIRSLTAETKDGHFGGRNSDTNAINELLPNKDQNFADIAKEISRITRTKLKWEETLLSDYPSINFSDPCFFQAFLEHQNNALLSLRFFNWLCSHCSFSPDQSSCDALFLVLVDAKAVKAAKGLLDSTGFTPGPASLEGYIQCLIDGGMVEEALDVFVKLKNVGFCPSVATWNASLFACLKIKRTDLFWTLYGMMMESNAITKIGVKTAGYLIQAFCMDNNVLQGYELLWQVLEDGLCPDNPVFNTLISCFCKQRQYARVSELIHTMISKRGTPDIATYHQIIYGLLKKRKNLECFQLFNDLKDRGYFPDRGMYTTMIKCLCYVGLHGEARKLWFEMIYKGIPPNEQTYNVMIYGYCKIGNFDEAKKLLKDMCNRGYKETAVIYNTMISGLCSHGRTDEAQNLFEEMSKKSVVHDVITYNSLIRGLCYKGKLVDATKTLNELMAQGLEPTTYSYTPLINELCKVGDTQEAMRLWKDMHGRHLKPLVSTHDNIISGLCKQGYLAEGMECLLDMLSGKLKPRIQTFEILIQCLSQKDRLDDILVVLGIMLRIGYTLKESTIHSLVRKFGWENFRFGKGMEKIL